MRTLSRFIKPARQSSTEQPTSNPSGGLSRCIVILHGSFFLLRSSSIIVVVDVVESVGGRMAEGEEREV